MITLGSDTLDLTLDGGAVWAYVGSVRNDKDCLFGGSSMDSALVMKEAGGVLVLAAGFDVTSSPSPHERQPAGDDNRRAAQLSRKRHEHGPVLA